MSDVSRKAWTSLAVVEIMLPNIDALRLDLSGMTLVGDGGAGTARDQ